MIWIIIGAVLLAAAYFGIYCLCKAACDRDE